MTANTVRFVGKHQHSLPSGRPIAFGDELTVSDDTENPADLTTDEANRLVDAGALVEIVDGTAEDDTDQPDDAATPPAKRPRRRTTTED